MSGNITLEDCLQLIEQLTNENTNLKNEVASLRIGRSEITPEQFDRVEQRNRDLQDEMTNLRRLNTDLETKNNMQAMKIIDLEGQIKKINDDMTTGVSDARTKDLTIEALKKKIEGLESTISKQRENSSKTHEEKNLIEKTTLQLEAVNKDLQQACKDLIDRNQELMDVLKENSDEMAQKDELIDKLEKKLITGGKGKTTVKKQDKKNDLNKPSNVDDNEFAEMQERLTNAKKRVREYKERIIELQEESHRATRLAAAMETRQKQIDNLKDLLDKNESELRVYKGTAEDLSQQIAYYREENNNMAIETTAQIKMLREENARLRTEHTANLKTIESLRQEMDHITESNTETRRLLSEYESNHYGLPEAINEMRELHAVVEVREKHIAELIQQVNSMDKLINGLISELGIRGDFDMEQFLKDLDKKNIDDEKLRMDIASRELEAKIAAMRSRLPLGNIEIVVDSQNGGANIDMEKYTEQYNKQRRHSKKNRKHHRNRSPAQSERLFDPEEEELSSGSSASLTLHRTQNMTSTSIHGQIGQYADQSVQATEEALPPVLIYNGEDRDEWVQNLQKQYLELKAENEKLKKLLASLNKQADDLTNENERLKAENNSQQAEIEDFKKRWIEAQNELATRIQLPTTPIKPADPVSPIKSKDPWAECKSKPTLFISMLSDHYAVPEKHSLIKLSLGDRILSYPSREDITYAEEYEADRNKKISDLTNEIKDYKGQLADKADVIRMKEKDLFDLRDLIKQLEKKLEEQREDFKIRLRNMEEESARVTEARIREIQQAQALMGGGAGAEGDYSRIPEAAKRIKHLNAENAQLKSRIQEMEEIAANLKTENERYRTRIKGLEADSEVSLQRSEERAVPQQSPENQQLHTYLKKLQYQNQELKRKVDYLKEQNEGLKKMKPEFDTVTAQQDNENEDQHEKSELYEKAQVQLRQMKAKYVQLKTSSEEAELRLQKERETTERLKLMLQKRESAVQKLTDKYNQYKHQNEKLKAALIRAREELKEVQESREA